jgi:hypothetical protein
VGRPDWVGAYRDQCAEFERLVVPFLDKDRAHGRGDLFGDAETLVDFEPALLHADLGPGSPWVQGRECPEPELNFYFSRCDDPVGRMRECSGMSPSSCPWWEQLNRRRYTP